jgi:hypothetical protein
METFVKNIFNAVSGKIMGAKLKKHVRCESPDQNLITNNSNSNKMTKAELQAQHPELYNSIVAEGVSKEKDRTKQVTFFTARSVSFPRSRCFKLSRTMSAAAGLDSSWPGWPSSASTSRCSSSVFRYIHS